MKIFICIIRINQKNLNPNRISELNSYWENMIRDLVKNNQLLEINLLRNPGAVIAKDNTVVYGHYANDDQMTVTGFLKIKCKDIDAAVELSKKMPTLLFGGIIEIKELKEEKKLSN